MNDFSHYYNTLKNEVETFLQKTIFPELKSISHPLLFESLLYCLGGGKRIRPVLCLAVFLSGQESQKLNNSILYTSVALESIHAYSLIHDDLPSMDNDDYRRNLPSCHKKFGEDVAILTGDALNSFAFFLISKIEKKDEVASLIQILHQGAGLAGMISGQMYDLSSEGKKNHKQDTLFNIYHKKTAALIIASLQLGATLNESFPNDKKVLLKEYGTKLGFLFQLKDDILDIEGKIETIGKTPGKDEKVEKLTYPSFFSLDKSRETIQTLQKELILISDSLFPDNVFFKELPNYIVQRKN